MSAAGGNQPTSPARNPQQDQGGFCWPPLKCRCWNSHIPQRVILAIMLHLCLQTIFTSRVALNVAIVEMVAPEEKSSGGPVACPQFLTANSTRDVGEGKFPWPQETKSLVLYAFYIGYTFTQIPGGWIADKFGGRIVIASSILLTTVTTAIFPLATEWGGYRAAVALRFFLGLSHGLVLPAVSSMVSTWFPHHERAMWGGIAYAGSSLGTILGNIITGVLIHEFDWWPVAFYFWAAYSGVYFLMVLLLLYSFPDTHPYITQKELNYIRTTTLGGEMSGSSPLTGRPLKTPWKEILTNGPYWANVAAQFGHNYIALTLITYLPTYLREVLHFNVKYDGYFAAAPFVALWLTSLLLSATAKYFIKYTSERTFNTVFGAGSNVVSSALALGAVYVGCNRKACIALYMVSMVVKAFYYVTLPININVLSRNYGGIMFGLCNAMGSLAGIIGNYIIGALTKNNQQHEWQLAFWITFGVCTVTAIVFALFSSEKRQDFDFTDEEPRLTNGS